MTPQESQQLLDAVHGELRDSFMKSMPERIATIQRLAGQLAAEPAAEQPAGRPATEQVLNDLHAETHRLAGTSAVYGLPLTSSVARQFNHLVLEYLHSDAARLTRDLVDSFLQDLTTALHAES